jgi:hypothetical protein
VIGLSYEPGYPVTFENTPVEVRLDVPFYLPTFGEDECVVAFIGHQLN